MKKMCLLREHRAVLAKATALLLTRSGYSVFATVRNEADALALRSEATEMKPPILLDVTNWEQIKQAHAQIAEAAGNDCEMAIINNAGINYHFYRRCKPGTSPYGS